jgi:ATP-dependent protease ClpP protease subunit
MKQGIFLRDIAADATEAVIDIVGVIGWEVQFENLRGILRSIPDTVGKVVFDIYSPGGDIWEGNGIIQEIGAMKQHTVARVQVAASMATLIAVACKERVIAANGRFLIHNAWTVTQGDAAAHEQRAKELRDCENEAVKFYASRTGKAEADIRALMQKETWLTPAEAVEWGFASKIDDPFKPEDFKAVKDEIQAAGKWPLALVEMPEEGKQNANGNTEGTAGNEGGTTPNGTEKPVVLDVEAIKAEYLEKGRTESDAALLARAVAGEERLLKLTAEFATLTAKLESSISAERKLQAERDRTQAALEKNQAALDEANSKITRLLSGGMSFSPSIETWAQALAACKGDYAEARKQHPELYKALRAEQKNSQK